jgi:hypothetical protein
MIVPIFSQTHKRIGHVIDQIQSAISHHRLLTRSNLLAIGQITVPVLVIHSWKPSNAHQGCSSQHPMILAHNPDEGQS